LVKEGRLKKTASSFKLILVSNLVNLLKNGNLEKDRLNSGSVLFNSLGSNQIVHQLNDIFGH